MNVLLILSALLSALTGVQAGARASVPAVAVARVVEVTVVSQGRAAVVDARRAAVAPTLATVLGGGVRQAWRLAAIAPLYLSRRRE